ncbi:flippase [Pseudomonas umsongensis]|uniref:flippase n=1 Tax=Pseudomonas umsongensis TaxID=198618 RepID=UPI0015BCD2D2|nr:flippase [Pseudomonas umsongensis]
MQYKNIFWNLLGLGLPLLIAALTVPGLISVIGTERFGFLALAWGLIGYAGALDLGVGRAVTLRLASLRGRDKEKEIPDVISTAVRITTVIGTAGFVLIVIGSCLGGYNFVPRQTVSVMEVLISLLLLALAIPMQAISATYRGVNEAYLNFKNISFLRIALGAANFGAPFLVAQFTNQLYWLIGTLVLSRGIALFMYRKFAYQCLPAGEDGAGKFTKVQANKLLTFGGWVTVSSIVSPFLVQADRFFVGTLISAAAVTAYVIPYEITVQALILVGAITTVAFPVITGYLQEDINKAHHVFNRWLVKVSLVMFCVMGCVALLMPYILNIWVGKYVSEESTWVGRILCVGVFFNAIGSMYYSFLHASGRSKETAILHLIELPMFVGALYVFITYFGVVGAALAWTLRVVFDSLGLFYFTKVKR